MWRLQAVVVPLLGAAALAPAGAGLWTLVAGGPFRQRAAVALLVLGTVIAVSGGNILPRMTSNAALGFASSGPWRPRTRARTAAPAISPAPASASWSASPWP